MEVDALTDKTIQFSIKEERDEEMRQVLRTVYDALGEKGYNPISQIVGYILSEDPTYITTHNNARSLIRKLDRDDCYRLWCAVIWMRNSPLCIIRLRGGLPVGGPPFCEPSAVAFLTRGGKYAMINRF